MKKKIKLPKKDRLAVAWHSIFIQGSWNYEHMQDGGWAFSMIPVIKKLCKTKEGCSAALKRHLGFSSTHPCIASPVLEVTLALEGEHINGVPVGDMAIQGVRVDTMGPLAGVGDPVFWFMVCPVLDALGAPLVIGGNILGPIIFFSSWNVIHWVSMRYTQEFGCKAGSKITGDPSGGLSRDITRGISISGMFVLAAPVQRRIPTKFLPIVSTVKLDKDIYIEWDRLPSGGEETKSAFEQVNNGLAFSPEKVTTLQDNSDQLTPGSTALGSTLLYIWLFKKKISPIIIILDLFIVGVVRHIIGFSQSIKI